MSELFRITTTHIIPAAQVCARAFMNDLQIDYFMPERKEREKYLYLFYAFLLRYGVHYGKVYATSSKLEGVIVWLPSQEADMPLWRMVRCGVIGLVRQAGIRRILRLQHFAKPVFDLHHSCAPFPHEYLFLLAVDPHYQGQGFARQLIQPRLQELDQQKLSCFLETHTEDNVALYERFGFKNIRKITIPETKLNFWGMVRQPT
jgi:ribosomal protein S18 acetylase RimI-like enzyme